MNRLLIVLLALAAAEGCASTSYAHNGLLVADSFSTSGKALATIQTVGAREAMANVTNGTSVGYVSHMAPDGTVTMVSSTPAWAAYGSYGGAGGVGGQINPWAAAYIANTSPPPGSVQQQGGSASRDLPSGNALSETLVRLEDKVDAQAGDIADLKGNVGVILDMHAPAGPPPKKPTAPAPAAVP